MSRPLSGSSTTFPPSTEYDNLSRPSSHKTIFRNSVKSEHYQRSLKRRSRSLELYGLYARNSVCCDSMKEESRSLYGRASVYHTPTLNLITTQKTAPEPAKPQRSKNTTAIVVTAFCLLAIAASLEAVIVSTALPRIKEGLSSGSSRDYAWAGSAYLLALTSMLPVWARLSDIYGRRPAMIAADSTFIAGSILCALAPKMEVLLAGRAIQGLGGGGLLVLINICTTDMFSLRDRGMYISIFGAITAITAAAAPVLGGWFAENLSWRWCFWVNVPPCVVALVLVTIFLRIEISEPTKGLQSIDWLGLLTVTGGTINFLVGLQMGGLTQPWSSALVLGLITSGSVLFALFVLTQWKVSRFPLVPGRIVRHSINMAYLAISFCHGFTYISVVYYLPVYFQLVLNASPIDSGLWLLPTALSMGFASAISGLVIKGSGRYLEVTWISVACAALGLGLFITLPDHKSWPRMISFQMLVGCGLGPLFQAPLIGLLSRTCPQDVAAVNSLFAFFRSLGSALSIVVGQVMIQHWLSTQTSDLRRDGVPASLVAKFTKDFAELAGLTKSSLPLHQMESIRDALNTALKAAWILYATVAILACLIAFTIPRSGPLTQSDRAGEELQDL